MYANDTRSTQNKIHGQAVLNNEIYEGLLHTNLDGTVPLKIQELLYRKTL
jgi:hypothetical protein